MNFDPTRSIFPVVLLDVEQGAEGNLFNRGMTYLGTGFFLRGRQSLGFVTARHVVDVPLRADQRIGVLDPVDGRRHSWAGFEFHSRSDIAVARFGPGLEPSFAVGLPAHQHVLAKGCEVFSYGFPLSGKVSRDGREGLALETFFFRGHVATHWGREDLAGAVRYPFRENLAISFEALRGLSGAPLLIWDEKPFVAGIVYENRQIEFFVEEIEEVHEDGLVGRTVTKRLLQFGLAGEIHDLNEILEL